MIHVRTGKGKSICEVDGSLDISFRATHKTHHGIDLKSSLLFGTAYLLDSPCVSLAYLSGTSVERHFPVVREESSLLEVSEDTPRLGFRDVAEVSYHFLSQAVVFRAECDDTCLKLWRDAPCPASPRCRIPLVETVQFACCSAECLLPVVQGSSRYLERLLCWCIPVLLPEHQYPKSFLRLLLVVHTGQS